MAGISSMFDQITMALRFARDLRGYLRQPMSLAASRQRLTQYLNNRSTSFLEVVERGIYQNQRSPYLALLKQAGIPFEQVRAWVTTQGVEAALGELYQAGVYVTIDEFKGRRPIQRLGLDLTTSEKDFDNPLMTRHFEARSGGSTSRTGNPVSVDLNLQTHETAHDALFIEAFNLFGRPIALWRPGPPASSGLNISLRRSKLGQPVKRWFSQTPVNLGQDDTKYRLFLWLAVYASRFYGRPVPQPEYVPLEQAIQVAQWLAAQKAGGTPAVLDTNVGSGIRVCLAAKEAGLDISGTFFRLGSEPYTEARARIVAEAGCRAVCHYFMSETSRVGAACAAGEAIDDMHILLDKLALIQRAKILSNDESVGAFYLSTLHTSTAKLMLNVQTGDYGVLTERQCGCLLGQLGLHTHVHSIRSFDKLTSDGMNFLGSELITLIEDVLPAKFGGNPTDYQLVEFEDNGLTRVNLIVSPRLGPINEQQVVETSLQTLGAYGGGKRMMANYWREGETLQVERREPYATRSAKIPVLYNLRDTPTMGNGKNESKS
jgi:hypothetical protein